MPLFKNSLELGYNGLQAGRLFAPRILGYAGSSLLRKVFGDPLTDQAIELRRQQIPLQQVLLGRQALSRAASLKDPLNQEQLRQVGEAHIAIGIVAARESEDTPKAIRQKAVQIAIEAQSEFDIHLDGQNPLLEDETVSKAQTIVMHSLPGKA